MLLGNNTWNPKLDMFFFLSIWHYLNEKEKAQVTWSLTRSKSPWPWEPRGEIHPDPWVFLNYSGCWFLTPQVFKILKSKVYSTKSNCKIVSGKANWIIKSMSYSIFEINAGSLLPGILQYQKAWLTCSAATKRPFQNCFISPKELIYNSVASAYVICFWNTYQ